MISLLTSWAWGVEEPSVRKGVRILIITFGVLLTGTGELTFSWLGIMFQAACLVFDANRLVMIQVLLSKTGTNMEPMVSLYYTAPCCVVMNCVVFWYSEYSSFSWTAISETGPHILVLNAAIGFALNISIYLLVSTVDS